MLQPPALGIPLVVANSLSARERACLEPEVHGRLAAALYHQRPTWIRCKALEVFALRDVSRADEQDLRLTLRVSEGDGVGVQSSIFLRMEYWRVGIGCGAVYVGAYGIAGTQRFDLDSAEDLQVFLEAAGYDTASDARFKGNELGPVPSQPTFNDVLGR